VIAGVRVDFELGEAFQGAGKWASEMRLVPSAGSVVFVDFGGQDFGEVAEVGLAVARRASRLGGLLWGRTVGRCRSRAATPIEACRAAVSLIVGGSGHGRVPVSRAS